MLHVDGSSTLRVGGARILLQGPGGVEIEIIAKLDFPTTNNEVEYEALTMGLEMALEVGVKQLDVYTDSQLVAMQIEISYQEKKYQGTRVVEIWGNDNWSEGKKDRGDSKREGIDRRRGDDTSNTLTSDPNGPVKIAYQFGQWGIDIFGPFPPAPAQKKFIIVAVEYSSKWMETEALAKNSEIEQSSKVRAYVNLLDPSWEYMKIVFRHPVHDEIAYVNGDIVGVSEPPNEEIDANNLSPPSGNSSE
ncbi:hypothetical protein Sango_1249100 [Sesamum angolense]|uniref:RNase H type-1 domain-containing protein n=1 Tax=Sesamum angolense TaxID=2727404 RepID=A0AAE1WQH7_9LAMI|nr:hypothetical protein Sango_1249100 [Sesamum angolense]